MANVVWILGAGFSRSLGGPLLGNLFTPGSKLQLEAYFPDADRLHNEISIHTRALYAFGKEQLLWSDAEEFLDKLDAAARTGEEDDNSSKLFMATLIEECWPDFKFGGSGQMFFRDRPIPTSHQTACPLTFSSSARRILAAECSAFLKGADTHSERWSPYIRWAKQLSGDGRRDTIITFNYDRVLESLKDHIGVSHQFNNCIHVVLPGKYPPGAIDVLKLHGSIDWMKTPGLTCDVREDPYFAVHADDSQIAIAIPGPGKQETVNQLFKGLWRHAEAAIKEANEIYFVGYRFPPTDATARERLLGAIARNRPDHKEPPTYHIVLGPNTKSPDVQRLVGLLKSTGRVLNKNPDAGINVHPMYAEDFFSVFSGSDVE